MSLAGQGGKWVGGGLGVVCLVLLINLGLQLSGRRVRAARPTIATPPSGAAKLPAGSVRSADPLARYDPVVRLDTLKELQGRRLPQFARNPFEFDLPRPAPQATQAPVTPVTPQPAGPPPVPLKAVGYGEKAGGVREAYVSDEQQIHIVHEGETFAKRFKVLKISPTVIEVEDEASHQTVKLPIPQ